MRLDLNNVLTHVCW